MYYPKICTGLIITAFLSFACGQEEASNPKQPTQTAPNHNTTTSADATNPLGEASDPVVVSSSEKEQKRSSTESFNYEFAGEVNGDLCETKQSFATKANYCEGLKDEALNKNCAIEDRKALYDVDCLADYGPFS